MDFILKPVISCAGDENLLPYFESRCLSTLGSQQVVWKHPKLSMVHSVRLGACFTRFRVSQLQSNVKVLSSGRPIRPVGTFQPLLYIYVTSNDVSHYTSHGGRNAIGSWLGHLRARNVFDWLIIMVNSDPQYNTPKILQKSNVLDKIKSDFNVRTGDRQFLEVPAPNSAEEKLFNESWNQLTYLVRKSIISACMSIIVDYDVHLQMLTDSCSTFTWDYFEYLDRKEELAHMYLFLGGHEHALHEYREATELLSKCIQASTQQGSKRPQWLDRLTQLSSSNEVSHYVCDYSLDVTNTEIKQSSRLKNRNATLFELKNYLLSRQASILCICDRLNEFPALAYHTICSTLTEINILNIQTDQLFHAVWILCICLNTLTNIRLDSDRSMDDVNKSIIELLDTAFSCNNILENINFTRLSKLSFHRSSSSSSSSSSTHSPSSTPTITTQSVFIDANKDSNVTIWYMSHLVDKIFTHFRCHEYQLLRNISPLSPINNVTSSTENSSIIHKLSSIKINENDTFCSENYSVELWLIIFNYIKQIGQLIGLWCIKSNLPIHREKYSLLNKVINDSLINQQSTRDSIQQQQQYDLVDQLEIETDQTKADQIQLDHSILFAHNHLIPLFTSSIIYSQIFTAIGQTLIGFLKLIHCPKRAYEIVYDLADFLFSQGAHESASWLYESLINHYDESSWIGLVTSTRICLAWCFHSLCVKKHFETKEDYEIARKYIQICFILAGTKCSILRIAAIHVYNKIQFWYQTINFTEILSIPTFNDSINPNYWWEEAVEFRNSLLSYHQYVILDPYQMSPLFRLKSIELEGVCNCGYQLIFIQLKSNSDRTFKASVHISGSEPSYIDWQTLLNPNEFLPYHVMDKTNQLSMPQLDSQLHLINLTTAPSISVVKSLAGSNVHNPITIGSSNNNNRNSNNNSSGSHKVISRGQYSISSEKNSIQYNKYHLPTTEMTASIRRSYSSIPDSSKEYLNRNLALKGNQLRISKMNSQSRLGSLLNVAASLASRPAWKSQDTIGVMSDEHNNTPMSTPHIIRNGRMIRIPSDGLIEPNIHSSVQISRQHSLCSTKKRSRLSFSINGKHDMFGNENTESSTPVSTKNPLFILNHEESFVMIKPGLNKLSFIANVPGFLIPEQIFINCLDEINTEFKEASREQQSMEPSNNSRSEVNFVSDIDSDVFGSSWRDTAMMKALLPKPEISVLNNSGDKRYPVVFGTCQPIPVRLRLGKLGLPEDCKLSTSLYRICSNNKNFVFNTKPENTHINVKKTNSMKTYNNTNGNDGNETMFNNQTSITVDSSYEIRNQYSANDYSLISNSLDNHHQDEHLHKKHQTLFSQFILEDGPVDFIREYNSLSQSLECKMNHPIPTFPPGCCLQLSRPLYLSATSCNDQFALSMPSGHYCILPVDIIKPLGFNLNIFPLPKTYVIFSLNITCVDSDPDSTITPEVYYSQNLLCKYPVTFELSNMRFYICASKLYLSRRLALSSSFSNGQHQLYNRQLKSRSHVSMEDNRQIAGDFTKNDVHETGSTDKLHDTINESIESLTGDLLDNRITKAYVTHLTPFSIPWRFKSLEYNNFMKLCKESHCQPIGRFECTMNRIGNVKKINQDIRVDCVIGQQI
uniref:Trafficking protein particle complex subunit 10 n=3 Tax=Schistosoma mansoni TaxID=6183 RepID=A0A5K4FB76_SCHMA